MEPAPYQTHFDLAHARGVFFDQHDERWSSLPYGGATMAERGCGLCAFAMATDIVTGGDMSPLEVYERRMEVAPDDVTFLGTWYHHGPDDGNPRLNEWNERLFAVRTRQIAHDADACLEALSDGRSVVLAVSNAEPGGWRAEGASGAWRRNDGSLKSWQHNDHTACIWLFDGTHFHMKDSGVEAQDDALYTPEQLTAWLSFTRPHKVARTYALSPAPGTSERPAASTAAEAAASATREASTTATAGAR